MFELVPLVELGKIVSGATPNTNVNEYWNGEIPWITPADLTNHFGVYFKGTLRKITKSGFDSCSTKLLPPKSILFSSRAPIGYCAVTSFPLCTNQGFKSLIPNHRLHSVYGYFALLFFTPDIVALGRGATFAEVNTEIIENFRIPVPSIEKQKHISAVLEKANKLRRQRRYALELSNTFLQSVFLKMFGDPITNPMGWKVEGLQNVAEKFSDGPFGSNLKTEHYRNSGVRVIRLQNIGIGQFLDDDKAFISQTHFKTLNKHRCIPGDVIVGTMGDPNLRACILPKEIPEALNKADCVLIRPNPIKVNSEYICWLLNLPNTLFMARRMILGQTRERISMGRLAELMIPVGSLPLQQKFAQTVHSFERLRAQQREAERQAEHLFQTLLHRAFRGEMTEQKSSTVIAFPRHNSVDDQGAILSYIVNSQWQQPTFGHVKCAKFIYWVSAHIGVDLGGEYWREAAGPLADFFYPVEKTAEEKDWFYAQERSREGYSYSIGPNISERVQAAIEILGDRKEKLDKLLELLAGVASNQIEAAATLFAVWNDLLIDGHQPTDNEIIREAMENWHPEKRHKPLFNQPMLKVVLKWIRDIKLTPEGIGPRTIKRT